MPGQNPVIISERQRTLDSVTFSPSTVQVVKLPRDTVLKYLQVRLSGAIQTTYGSGTPVADAMSTLDNLVSYMDVVVNGSTYVKNVRPFLMEMQQLLFTGINNERKSSAGAAAVIDPTVDGGFVYGTTTQYTSVAESCLIAFENVAGPVGKETTWLNLKGVASAELRFNNRAYSALLGYGNTAPVTYGNSTFVINTTTIEAQDVPAEKVFSLFKQTTADYAFTAQTNNRAIEINRGNFLQGLLLYAQDGAAGSATTATGKLASNLLVTDMQLKVNGQQEIKATSFLKLQAENKNKFGILAPFASNVSRLDGIAYLDLLRDGDVRTALDTRPPLVDMVQLFVSTRSASDVTYTATAQLNIMTNEIVPAL